MMKRIKLLLKEIKESVKNVLKSINNLKIKIEISFFVSGLLFFIFSIFFKNNALIYVIFTVLSMSIFFLCLMGKRIITLLKIITKTIVTIFFFSLLLYLCWWTNTNCHGFPFMLFSILLYVCILIFVFYLVSKFINLFLIINDAKIKKSSYKPYKFDIKYEMKTYDHIGRDYMKANTSRKISFKSNKKQKGEKYEVCNTYSEWENHIKSILHYEMSNKEDFVHWLYKNKNWEKQFLEAIKTIQIPIYVALLSLLNHFGEVTIWTILFSIIIIVIFSLICFFAECQEVNFYEDIIKIVEKEFGVEVN